MKTKTQKKRRAPRASSTSSVRPLPWTGSASTAQMRVARASAIEATRKHRVAPPAPSPGLTGYLVLWRHTMDDVPVGLFRTKEAAIAAANKTSFRAGYAAAKKLDIDCRTPVCFAVVAFDNGKPTEMLFVNREDDA